MDAASNVCVVGYNTETAKLVNRRCGCSKNKD